MSELFNPEEATFETLVGEGKKFKDGDALVKKAIHADQHIDTLQTELSELRTELAGRSTMEEMLDKIQSRQAAPTPQTPTRETPPINRQDDGSPKEEKTDLQSEVKKLLEAEKNKDRRDRNIDEARTGLKERFGADYNVKLKQIAKDLEVSEDYLTSVAASSPKGFLKLIESVAPKDDNRPTTPPRTAVDPARSAPLNSDKKNSTYYRELKKSDPVKYFSKKVQMEMHDQAMKLGSAFYEA